MVVSSFNSGQLINSHHVSEGELARHPVHICQGKTECRGSAEM